MHSCQHVPRQNYRTVWSSPCVSSRSPSSPTALATSIIAIKPNWGGRGGVTLSPRYKCSRADSDSDKKQERTDTAKPIAIFENIILPKDWLSGCSDCRKGIAGGVCGASTRLLLEVVVSFSRCAAAIVRCIDLCIAFERGFVSPCTASLAARAASLFPRENTSKDNDRDANNKGSLTTDN